MVICLDYPDLFSKIEPTEKLGMIYISCKNPSELLHEGHSYLISTAKTSFDKIAVIFCVSTLFDSFLYPQYQWPAFSNAEFDTTGCMNWCVENGIDYYLLNNSVMMQNVITNSVTPELISQVDSIWQAEGYPAYPQYNDSTSTVTNTEFFYYTMVKTWMIGHLANPKSGTFIYSWKDGVNRFIMKDFAEKYMTSKVELLDPVLDEDGVYLSSSLTLSEDERNIIKQIPTVVDQVGYSNVEVLKQSLNALDTQSLGFEAYRIDVVIGGIVGTNNDFINVFYQFPGKANNYPIYKRNVR